MPTPTEMYPPCDLHLLFSALECQQIKQMALEAGMQTATRIAEDGSLYVDKDYRSCDYLCVTPGHPIYSLIAERIFNRVKQLNRRYQFELYATKEMMIPSININRYRAEDEGKIGSHTDFGPFKETMDRKLSLSILLSEPSEFDGGMFFINDGQFHTPFAGMRAGHVCAFPSFALHGVGKVTRGDRWSAVIWLRGAPYR